LVAIGTAYAGAAFLTYNLWGLFLPVIPTIATFLLVGLAGLTVRQVLQRRPGAIE